MFARLSVGLVLVSAAVAPAALAIRLTPGDLLVLDATNQKILHVDVATGAVDDFVPRGGGSNLIAVPRGIASSPEGEVYVTNYTDAALVKIDAASGAQSIVEFFSGGIGGPLDLGTHPAGVAVSPSAPPVNGSRDVYVSSQGALYRVQRNLFGTTTTSVPYPNGYEAHEGQFLSIGAIGFGQLFGYIYAPPALFSYDGSSETIQVQLADVIYWVRGLEYLSYSPFFSAFLSIVIDTCPLLYNGVDSFLVTLADYAVGGDLSCPGALTTTPQGMLPFAFYVIDEGSNPPRIVRFDSAGAPPPTSVVATLPAGAVYPDMAVYAPEPGAGSTGAIALAGLTALGALRRWRRSEVSRRCPSPA